MSDVYVGRFNRWVEKFFNVKGGPTIVDISPDIQIDVPIDRPVDEKFQQGWNRFGSVMNGSAVAAQFSSAQIRNPTGSNIIAVLESIIVVQLSVVTRSLIDLVVNTGSADLASIGTNVRIDGRTGSQGSSMIVSSGATAAIAGVIGSTAIAGLPFQFIQFEDQTIQILPGDLVRLSDVTANEAITGSFLWRERALESSELT